jgi:hypothetical protein
MRLKLAAFSAFLLVGLRPCFSAPLELEIVHGWGFSNSSYFVLCRDTFDIQYKVIGDNWTSIAVEVLDCNSQLVYYSEIDEPFPDEGHHYWNGVRTPPNSGWVDPNKNFHKARLAGKKDGVQNLVYSNEVVANPVPKFESMVYSHDPWDLPVGAVTVYAVLVADYCSTSANPYAHCFSFNENFPAGIKHAAEVWPYGASSRWQYHDSVSQCHYIQKLDQACTPNKKWDSTKWGPLYYYWRKVNDKRSPAVGEGYVVGPGINGTLNTTASTSDVTVGAHVMSGGDYMADTQANKVPPADDTQMWPVGRACAQHTGCTVAYNECTTPIGNVWKFTLPAGNGRTLWFCRICNVINGQVMQDTLPLTGPTSHPVMRASAKATLQECAEFLLQIPYGWNDGVCTGHAKNKEVDLDCAGLCCEARVLQGHSASIRGLYQGAGDLVSGTDSAYGVTTTTALGEPPLNTTFTATAHMVGLRRKYQTSYHHVAVVKDITWAETAPGSRLYKVTGGRIIEAQGWDDADITRPDGTTPHSSAERVVDHPLTTEYPQGTQLYHWQYKFSRFIN